MEEVLHRGCDRPPGLASQKMGDATRRLRLAGRSLGVAATVVLLLMMAVGCSRRRPAEPLRIALESAPRTLDPHHHNEVAVWSVLCNFYDGLVRFSPAMELEPGLALSWQQTAENRTRFTLRPGVRFHNGDRLTSADVVASFRRAMTDPLSMIRHHLVGIRDLRAEGENVVVVETEGPAPTILNRLAFLFIVPTRLTAVREITEPVGTGPYRFAGRRADGAVLAEGWRGWWDVPKITQVVFSFVEDDGERVRGLLTGELDVVARLPFDVIGEGLLSGAVHMERQPRLAVQVMVVVPGAGEENVARALADSNVRRALLMALDRRRWASQVFRGNAIVASQYVHPIVFGYDPGIHELPYDPAEARRLLTDAGFADGFIVELGHSLPWSAAVDAVVEDLQQVGVRVRPTVMAIGDLVEQARARSVPLVIYGRTPTTGDASEFLDSSMHTADPARGFGGENFSGYSDAVTDNLLEQASREMNPELRRQVLQQAQRRVLQDLPVIPLTVWWDYVGVSERVEIVTRHDAWLWAAAYRWTDSSP